MKVLKIALKVDTFVQGLAILFGLGSVCAFAIDKNDGWIALTAFVLLGVVQILSAIILSLTLKDRKRGIHIAHSVAYFVCYIIVLPLIGLIGELLQLNQIFAFALCALYIIGVPIYLAIRYFKITVGDMVKVNTLHRSFWDI